MLLTNPRSRPKPKGSDSPHWRGHGEISAKYWFNVQRHAMGRQLEMDVSMEYAWDLFLHQDCRCALTGIELQFGINGTQTASLDRIDSNEGYTPSNIQWVHKIVNQMKMKLSQDELILWCKRIAGHAI